MEGVDWMRRPMEWPPWSPDLTPFNFFMGTFKKSYLHDRPDNLNDLKA